jgi:hypothetical protein
MTVHEINIVELIDLVSIPRHAEDIGWPVTKIRSKIKKGWTEGKEYFRTPHGDILISRKGYDEWSRSNTPESQSKATILELDSHTKASDTGQSSLGATRRKTTQRQVSYVLK